MSGQDEPNRALWFLTRAGKIELSCPLGSTRRVPREKIFPKPFIDQAFSVKMARYWPRSCFASLWTSTPSRSDNVQKNLANIQLSWRHAWSITHMYLLSLVWNFLWLRINCNVHEQSRLLTNWTQEPKMTWQSQHSCQCVYQDAVVSEAKLTSRTNIARWPATTVSRRIPNRCHPQAGLKR